MIIGMPDRELSVTAAARNFADAVNRAYYRRETTVLLKHGVPVARLALIPVRGRSASELAREWEWLYHLSAGEAGGLAGDIAAAPEVARLPSDPWD